MSTRILQGDCRELLATLPPASVHTCVTSPPYWGLRDYGVDGQLGLEPTPDEFVASLLKALTEVGRVLRPDGSLWLNLGDTFFGDSPPRRTGSEAFSKTWDPANTRSRGGTRRSAARCGRFKPKSLCGIPWMVALALQEAGWWLRSDVIWSKPNPRPEPVKDRPVRAHEYLFLLTRSDRYYYDAEAVRLAGRHLPSVWTVRAQNLAGAHFATFPPDLVEPCIRAGCPPGGVVLDPFAGACTTLLVAQRLGRQAIGIELNPAYCEMGRQRLAQDAGLFAEGGSE